MTNGIVFDIKEFALNDGPGIRVTVFLKGCPLKCKWCHNPESQKHQPEINQKTNRLCGKIYTPSELAEHLRQFQDVYNLSDGGITFSGGEPTLQTDFLIETLSLLPDIHTTLDTCGQCQSDKFLKIAQAVNLVYFDLKLADDTLHQKYTGISNRLILENLKMLDEYNIPLHIRIPLIPTITDTADNLNGLFNIIKSLKHPPIRIDLLPYNICAGGKYKNYGMTYELITIPNEPNQINVQHFYEQLTQNNFNVMKG